MRRFGLLAVRMVAIRFVALCMVTVCMLAVRMVAGALWPSARIPNIEQSTTATRGRKNDGEAKTSPFLFVLT